MSLQGSLDMFPVNEVLRMLVRSTRAAALTVETNEGRGAIHVAGGSVVSAEFAPVVGLVDALRIRGLVADDDAGTLEHGRRTILELVDEEREKDARHLIAERAVEALHRISDAGGGTFSVEIDRSPQIPTGFTFDLDELADLASLRAEEWSNALAAIGDRTSRFELCGPPEGTDEIVLSDASWRVACALGEAPTIRSAAAALGATEYEVVRELVQLVRSGLTEPAGQRPTSDGDAIVVTGDADTGAHRPDALESRSQAGWWQEPEPASPADSGTEEPTPSQDGWWEEPGGTIADDDHETGDDADSEAEDGSGLGIGRRSMGAFARRVLDA